MKTANDLNFTAYKYFIVQENIQSVVGIISDNNRRVYFCNLTLQPRLNFFTGKIEFKLDVKPETAVRSCANPAFKDKVQQGISRGMIDLIKDAAEVERHLLDFQKRNSLAMG